VVIISVRKLREFWQQAGREDAEQALRAWYDLVEQEDWSGPADVKRFDRKASFVGERVVFNIRGNRYRLIVLVLYDCRTVLIRWIGTHAEYDELDVGGV